LGQVCSSDCTPLFFADGHPTALGYRVVAAIVLRELLHRIETRPLGTQEVAAWQQRLVPEVRPYLSRVGL